MNDIAPASGLEPAPEIPFDVLLAAQVAHAANAALCAAIGDPPIAPWDEAPDWQKDSAINGVQFHIENPNASASASHENWMRVKLADGWIYGLVKDAEAKTHPCLVAFEQLPRWQQAKDRLFGAIVHALLKEVSPEQERIATLEERAARATELMKACRGLFRTYQAHHLAKLNHEKATRNGDMANALDAFLMEVGSHG